MAERSVNWDNISKDTYEGFLRFRQAFQDYAANDPNWQISQSGDHLAGEYVSAQYSRPYGKGVVVAQMDGNVMPRGTKGFLGFTIGEAWEFEIAESVLTSASDSLLPLLSESGLVPMPAGRSSIGRKSISFVEWTLYPVTHPKVQGRR